ncbi:MAG: hypothetical protein LBI53_06515 [Candidatus Peribacteria bacterium]|nr:hypothetical protein [Candidatus Peribacteria bacterium]
MDSFPDTEEVNTLLAEVLNYFSYYRSKADQNIIIACENALNNHNVSNRNQILTSLISKLPALKVGAEKKLDIMTKHLEAFRDNKVF